MTRWSLLLALTVLTSVQAQESARVLQRFDAGKRLRHHPIHFLGFSADGKSLHSVSYASGLARWNVATGNTNWTHGGEMTFGPGGFAPDGSFALLSDSRAISVVDTKQNRAIGVLNNSGYINALAVSPDGALAALGNDENEVELCDVRTGKQLQRWRDHDAYVTAVAFNHSSKVLASGAHDRTIRLYSTTTGKPIRVLQGHTDQVSTLAFLPDGKRLVSGSWDHTVRLWDIDKGKELHCYRGHRLIVKSVSVSGDGKRLATAGLDGLACLWDIETGKQLQSIEATDAGLSAAALSADGKQLATGSLNDVIALWDAATGKRKLVCKPDALNDPSPRTESTRCIAVSPDLSHVATGSDDGGVRVYESGKAAPRLVGRQNDLIWSLAFSPDSKHIASAGRRDGTVHVWDRDKGGEVKRFTGPKGGITRIAYSANGKILVCGGGSFDPAVHVWDVASGKELHRLEANREFMEPLAVSGNGKLLACVGRDNKVRLYELTTGKETRQFSVEDGCSCLGFRDDGGLLAVGDREGTVQLWDVATGKLRTRLGENANLFHVGFLPDGRTLVAVGARFELWELAVERVRHHKTIGESKSSVAVDPLGRRLALTGTAALLCDPLDWNASPGELTDRELELRWKQLADEPGKAFEALHRLTAAPAQAVSFFEPRLQPVSAVPREQLERWVADLSHQRFRVRDQAAREMAKHGQLAEAALRRGLKAAQELETRRRIEALLESATSLAVPPEQVRQLRMVEALEQMGTPEARRLLKKLAMGDPDARLTREAQESLQRLR